MRPIGGDLVTTITSPSCWGTHFLYLSNPPAGIPVPIIPCMEHFPFYYHATLIPSAQWTLPAEESQI